MILAAIDFETFWDSKSYTLSKMGAVEYIRDPRFHPLMLGVCTSDGVQVWETEEEMKAALEGLAAGGYAVAGHNMNGFDALIVSEYFGVDLPFVLDTQVMMRWVGLSRTMKRESHELLTARLGHGMKLAGTVVSDGKATKEEFTPEDWAFFKQYCADDTLQCYRNARSLLPFVSGNALRFSNLTARMATQPKFCLDADKIKQYIEDLDRKVAAARDELQDIFGFPTPEDMLKAIRSATTFADMLRTLGVEVPMKLSEKQTATQLKKLEAMGVINPPAERYYVYTPALAKSDTEFIDMLHHPDERVRLLVRTRLEYNSSIERSRAETLLKFALQHKPYPVQLGAFVAHTSRYTAKTSAESTSDKTNLQNLSKRNPEKLALRRAIHAPAGHKIVAVDSSQIEARLLAWAACQDDLVMQFREGRDPYAELAEKFGSGMTAKEIHEGAKSGNKKAKEQRNLAKTFVLSCLSATAQVLTDTGWKPIVYVTKNDKLWDGEQWVRHGGVICNGWRTTIDVDGTRMTPDHLIFDGSSWNPAEKYLSEPSMLSRAMSFAGERLSTLELNSKKMSSKSSICASVSIVGGDSGCLNNLSSVALKLSASIAYLLVEQYAGVKGSRQNTLTLNPVKLLENLRSFAANVAPVPVMLGDQNAMCWYNAPAGQTPIGCYSPTSRVESLRDATPVLRRNQLPPWIAALINTTNCALTKHLGEGFSRGLMQFTPGVMIQLANLMRAMGRGVSDASSQIVENFYRIYSRLKVALIHRWRLIELTTMDIMLPETFVSQVELCNLETEERRNRLSETSKQRTPNFERVYDIMNAGPNHRFMVKTDSGVVLCHNCGYGTSKSRAAAVLWTNGMRLHTDRVQHDLTVAGYHGIYREAVPNIVNFWRTCDQVLRWFLETPRDSGVVLPFGGPNGDMFKAAWRKVLPGDEEYHASIELPSGYKLWYPELQYDPDIAPRGEYYYVQYRRGKDSRKRIYGAALTENLIQSLAFQLLMWQACKIDELGIPLSVNLHDCWAAIVPEDKAEATQAAISCVMSAVPPWLSGFPVACEGEVGDTFEVV